MGQYDVVLNGGTLEHVFHTAHALANALRMAGDGGLFMHFGPMNNYVDHGFYQFSPTLIFDFATANSWGLEESAAIKIHVIDNQICACEISPLPPGRFGEVGALDSSPYLHYAVLRKLAESSWHHIPKQSYYRRLQDGADTDRRAKLKPVNFQTYRVQDGQVVPGNSSG